MREQGVGGCVCEEEMKEEKEGKEGGRWEVEKDGEVRET